jgi:multidrug resistance efflux pump
MPLDGYRTLARAGLFVGLVGIELYLAHSMSAQPSVRGYVESHPYSVSPSQKGRIRKLDVTIGQAVSAGQVIAELDASSIETDLKVKMEERKQIVSELRAAPANADSSAIEEKLRVADLELEQLAERRNSVRVKAPADGIIDSIDVRPGDTIGPSSSIATVVAADTRRVVACIPETSIEEVEVGSVASVRSVVGDVDLRGAVESLSPAIAILPERCQPPIGKKPTYGRVAVIVLDEPSHLLPGQSEVVSFGGGKRATPVENTRATTGAAPQMIDVPPEIVSASAFEASGLVWVPSLDRYVVVSDETGRDDTHPPWLFTMSRRGVVDPEPLVVEGIGQLDDIESIAAGDNGSLWLLGSQSVSEKGKRPKQRELLARLVPSGTGYKVDAKMHLASLLEAAPDSVRAALGVPDMQQLDLEGMAYRKGALYLGLKAPVDGQRRAQIWRVAAPERLLQNDLAGAQVAVWGQVALNAEVDDKPVPGGIADMLFLSDTQMLVTATASGINAKHQAGALYSVTGSGGSLRAVQVRAFPELRPEGIALGPDPHRLAIVFDRGHHAPMWLEIDLPELGAAL